MLEVLGYEVKDPMRGGMAQSVTVLTAGGARASKRMRDGNQMLTCHGYATMPESTERWMRP